jgi:hypothetical protein
VFWSCIMAQTKQILETVPEAFGDVVPQPRNILKVYYPVPPILQESCSLTMIYNSDTTTRINFSSILLSLLLLCSFITFYFSISIITVPRTTRSLHNDHTWRTQGNSLLLTNLSIFVLPWLTLTISLITVFHLTDSTGWRRIWAFWQQYWMDIWLD